MIYSKSEPSPHTFPLILTVSPIKALTFIIFISILQQVEGNLIYPKVVGGSLGLPAIWVLAAVTIGGALMGIMGMLIGVPIASAVYRLIRDDMRRKEQDRQLVKEEHLDFGFAFDGDCDRCIAVDENGNVVDGDKMLAIKEKICSAFDAFSLDKNGD